MIPLVKVRLVFYGCLPRNRQMSIKVDKNDFTRKLIDFYTFTKIA